MFELSLSNFSSFGIELEPDPAHVGSGDCGSLKMLVYRNNVRTRRGVVPSGRTYSPSSYFGIFEPLAKKILFCGDASGYDALIFRTANGLIDSCIEEIYDQSIMEFRTNPLLMGVGQSDNIRRTLVFLERIIQRLYEDFLGASTREEKLIFLPKFIEEFNSKLTRRDREFSLQTHDTEGRFLAPETGERNADFALEVLPKAEKTPPLFGVHFNVSIPLGMLFSNPMIEGIPIYSEYPRLREDTYEWPSCYVSSSFQAWERSLISTINERINSFCARELNIGEFGRITGLIRTISYSFAMLIYIEHSELVKTHFPEGDVLYSYNKDFFPRLPKFYFDDMVLSGLTEEEKELLIRALFRDGRSINEKFVQLLEIVAGIISEFKPGFSADDKDVETNLAPLCKGGSDTTDICLKDFFYEIFYKPLFDKVSRGISLIPKALNNGSLSYTTIGSERIIFPLIEIRMPQGAPLPISGIKDGILSMIRCFEEFRFRNAKAFDTSFHPMSFLVRPKPEVIAAATSSLEEEEGAAPEELETPTGLAATSADVSRAHKDEGESKVASFEELTDEEAESATVKGKLTTVSSTGRNKLRLKKTHRKKFVAVKPKLTAVSSTGRNKLRLKKTHRKKFEREVRALRASSSMWGAAQQHFLRSHGPVDEEEFTARKRVRRNTPLKREAQRTRMTHST